MLITLPYVDDMKNPFNHLFIYESEFFWHIICHDACIISWIMSKTVFDQFCKNWNFREIQENLISSKWLLSPTYGQTGVIIAFFRWFPHYKCLKSWYFWIWSHFEDIKFSWISRKFQFLQNWSKTVLDIINEIMQASWRMICQKNSDS